MTGPGRDSEAWAPLSRRDQQEQQEVLSCASLREVKVSEDSRPTSVNSSLYQRAKLCLGRSVESHLYPPNRTCPPRALPQHESCFRIPSAQVHRSSNNLQHTTRRFLVHFSLWSPDKCSSTRQRKADQYMHVVSEESFITCPFLCFL